MRLIAKIAHWCHLLPRSKHGLHGRMLTGVFEAGISSVKVRIPATWDIKVGLKIRVDPWASSPWRPRDSMSLWPLVFTCYTSLWQTDRRTDGRTAPPIVESRSQRDINYISRRIRPRAVIWRLRRCMCVIDSPGLWTSPCWCGTLGHSR